LSSPVSLAACPRENFIGVAMVAYTVVACGIKGCQLGVTQPHYKTTSKQILVFAAVAQGLSIVA
jgi:hypothetical protein